VTGSSLTGSGGPSRAIVWAGYLGDPVHAQWNDVVTGSGPSAGYLFLGGTATDPVYGVTAATVEKLRADGSTDANTYVLRFEPTFGAYRETDAIQHLALSPDGSTLFATANISTSTAFGNSGIVASIDTTAPRAFFTGFADSKFNGVAVSGTASNYSVLVTGAVANTSRPNGTDLLAVKFDSSLTTVSYAFTYQANGNSAGLSASADSSGNLYIGGTLQTATDTLAMYLKLDSTGMIPAAWGGFFTFGNVTPGQTGAFKGVVWDGGFLYGVGTLHDTTPGPYQTDMLIIKANDSNGSITGQGYGWRWFNPYPSGAVSGDINAMAEQVRGGRQYIAGGNYDLSPGPGEPVKSAFLFQMTATGDNLLANWFGGPSTTTQDIANGLSFATASGTDVFWAGVTTSTDLPVTDGSVYGGGFSDAWASRWVIA
jgi:hypothetical protein